MVKDEGKAAEICYNYIINNLFCTKKIEAGKEQTKLIVFWNVWVKYNTICGFMLRKRLVLDICSWQVSALNLEYIFLETKWPFKQKRRILKEKRRILIYKDGQLAIVGEHFV